MKIFENLANLKASKLTAGQLTTTKGFYQAGDGGGATYLIKTSADYGEIPDEYGDHTLAGGTIAVLQTEGSVNVKQFGATGDGVTDDSAAIQAAIDFTESVEGSLYFPVGDYYCADRLYINAPISLYGHSSAKIIFSDGLTYGNTDTTGGGAIDVLETTSFSCKGLTFVSNDATTAGASIIHLRGTSNITITDCEFIGDNMLVGSKSLTVQRGPTSSTPVKNVHITNNKFATTPNAVLVIGNNSTYITNVNISDNIVEGNSVIGGGGIKVDKYTNNVTIANNTMNGKNTQETAVAIEQGSYDVSVVGNNISNYTEYGITVADDSGDAGGLPVNDVFISGNHLYNIVTGIRFSSTAQTITTVKITGNTIDTSGNMIRIPDGNVVDLVITDNLLLNGAGCVINSDDLIFSNNVHKSSSTDYAVLINNSSCPAVITNNVFEQDASANAAYNIAYGAAHSVDCYIKGNKGLRANSERVSGTITLAPHIAVTEIYSSAGAVTATLPDGTYEGEIKTIHHSAVGSLNSSTVSVTNHETSSPEVFTFGDRNDTLVLMWMGNQWITIANSGAAV